MKHFGKLFGLATAVALAMATPTFAKDKVVIGELSWTGGVAIQNIMKVVIEKYLDGEVSFLLVGEAAMYPP